MDEECLSCKVILLGESGTGKCEIVRRFVDGYFKPS